MSSLQIDVECRVSPHEVLRQATAALQRMGYEVAATSGTETQLLFRAGSPTAAKLHEHRHRLRVSANGVTASFVFDAGVSHGGPVVEGERAELERRVNEVMRQISAGAVPAQPRTVRCPVCATPAADGAQTCATCGMALG